MRDEGFDEIPLEAGGEFIDGEHAEIRKLVADLGLQLQVILREGFGLALDLRGRVQLFKGMRPIWNEFKQALSKEAEAFTRCRLRLELAAASLIGRHSLADVLRARHASEEVLAMAQGLRGFYLADADQLSALPGVELAMQPTDPGHVTLSRIKGGNDRLVEKLAARKGLKVSLQLDVKRVEHDARGVSIERHRPRGQVVGDQRGLPGHDGAGADRPRSGVHAGVAGHVAAGAKALRPGPATKAHLLFDRAWWRQKGNRKRGDRTSTPARCGKRRAQGRAS